MDGQRLREATILIADDQEANVAYLERVLARAGCAALVRTTDARAVLPLYTKHRPDLIVLDLMMPHVDGYQVLAQIRALSAAGSSVPILVLTADSTSEAKQRALLGGATDFLTKPVDPVEVTLRIRNLLETRFLHAQLQAHNARLEEQVAARTQQLEAAQIEILARLAQAAEYRDDETGQHTVRVGQLAALLARALGLPANQVELLRHTAPLHDVGKIGIADAILHKPGPLTPAEYAEMQQHTIIGARLLAGSTARALRTAQAIALTHHERWDGTGYPGGLAGVRIPLAGRIVAVVDVFDALTHVRPYKSAWSLADALVEIRGQAGRHFDPEIVEALLRSTGQPEFAAACAGAGPLDAATPSPGLPVVAELVMQVQAMLDEDADAPGGFAHGARPHADD